MIAVLPNEIELGRQRYCAHCREWWPDDEEFFIDWAHWSSRVCRACYFKARGDRKEQLQAEKYVVLSDRRRDYWRDAKRRERARKRQLSPVSTP